ncbi:unnamed protein product [Toxocara canis]|uniref:Porin n=1 Tax=Toxocara canis TaxID=6265 RepID=A0A183URN5_TOXCA|nr:unnamed protein product [Toxocara canis]
MPGSRDGSSLGRSLDGVTIKAGVRAGANSSQMVGPGRVHCWRSKGCRSVELAGRLQLGYDERVNCINSNLARNRDDDSTPVRRAAFATRVPYNRSPLRALVCRS